MNAQMIIFYILILISFIILSGIITYYFICKKCTKDSYDYEKHYDYNFTALNDENTSNIKAMICSDIHLLPWSTVESNVCGVHGSHKIEKWADDLPIVCDNPHKCKGDVPVAVIKSAVKAYADIVSNHDDRLFLYCGDSFGHQMNPPAFTADQEKEAFSDFITNLLYHFKPEQVFISPGNHDAHPNKAFWIDNDTLTTVWADVLINAGIVDEKSNPSFRQHGFFSKPILNSDVEVISLNSVLYGSGNSGDFPTPGSSHVGCQTDECKKSKILQAQFILDTLSRLKKDNKKAIIITHFGISEKEIYDKVLGPYVKFDGSLLKGVIGTILSGHTHAPLKNYGNNYYNIPPILMVSNKSQFLISDIPEDAKLNLTNKNVYTGYCPHGKTVKGSDLVWKN